MKNELVIKKCRACGAVVKVLNDCTCKDCGIKCCGEKMELLVKNSNEASFEKHIPTYEIIEDEILVKVNHVMEKEHYIEWIELVDGNNQYIVELDSKQSAQCKFKYIPGSTIYSYCNKHELWSTDVK